MRVVCIIDALAKEFETRGYTFGADSEGRGHVRMEPDEVAITLTESPETGRLEKPVELTTCDYMPFADWRSELLAILGKTLEHKGYLIERVYNERRTPAEAAAEVDWERSLWW